MGLDMTLTQRITYDSDVYKIELTISGKNGPIDPERLSYIEMDAGSWEKAHAVHEWFVRNCQDGIDDCRQVEVTYEELTELRALCVKVIATKNDRLLPGTFFDDKLDSDYYDYLKETIAIIDALDPDGEYMYQSSW